MGSSHEALSTHARDIAEFLRPWRCLWDKHVVHVFSKQLWASLDPAWTEALKDVPLEQLLEVPSGFVDSSWPTSLRAFVSRARELALPREKPQDAADLLSDLLSDMGYPCPCCHCTWARARMDSTFTGGAQPAASQGEEKAETSTLRHALSSLAVQSGSAAAGEGRCCLRECRPQVPMFLQQGMNPKKQHEIRELAPLINLVARRMGATHVVDVGAGQGSLAQVLCFTFGLPVVAVEGEGHNSTVASARSRKAKAVIHRKDGAQQQQPELLSGAQHQDQPLAPESRLHEARLGASCGEGPGPSSGQAPGPTCVASSCCLRDPGSVPRQPQIVTATMTQANAVTCLSSVLAHAQGAPLADAQGATQPSQQASAEQGVPGVGLQLNGATRGVPEAPHGIPGATEADDRGREICKGSPRVLLLGLHACGDLSAAILRAFCTWHQAVAAISLGCCYNLLSEDDTTGAQSSCSTPPAEESGETCQGCACEVPVGAKEGTGGAPSVSSLADVGTSDHEVGAGTFRGYPLSVLVQGLGLPLGHSARDLACQSADRWRTAAVPEAAENFHLHAFRAALQVLLERQFPGMPLDSVRVGRLGKPARRRRYQQGPHAPHSLGKPLGKPQTVEEAISGVPEGGTQVQGTDKCMEQGAPTESSCDSPGSPKEQALCARFAAYSSQAFQRLGLGEVDGSLCQQVWGHVAPQLHLVRIFYVLRATLAPLLESLIILDRMLFLHDLQRGQQQACPVPSTGSPCPLTALHKQEAEKGLKGQQGSHGDAFTLLPIFHPEISPRNMAVIALRGKGSTHLCHPGPVVR